MNREEIEERISKIQEYIDSIDLLSNFATTGEQRSRALTYWGFAKMIKELFELYLTESSSRIQEILRAQEEINIEKERDKTTDWMTRWLKDLAKVSGGKP